MSMNTIALILVIACHVFIVGGLIAIAIERRTLLAGILMGLIVMSMTMSVMMTPFIFHDDISDSPIFTVTVLVFLSIAVTLFALFPFVAYIFVLINGIRVIRREGFSLSHALAAGSCVGLALLWVVSAIMSSWFGGSRAWNYLYGYANAIITYFAFIAGAYLLTHIINVLHLRKPRADYVVVLGAGLINDAVTPLLASRIRKGVEVARKSDHAMLVMSGGQGPDEGLPEGEAMARYAKEHLNVPPSSLLIEDRSETTEQNLRYCRDVIHAHWLTQEESASRAPRVAVVTNSYHVLRALMLARQLRIRCVGYGARTTMYFTVNAFIREYIAYIVMTKKVHLIMLGVITVMTVVMIALSSYGGAVTAAPLWGTA